MSAGSGAPPVVGWLELSLLVRWLLGWALGLRLPLPPAGDPAGPPTCSVLIPARNEAATLPHLLAALGRQRLRPLEVIVIDDDSSDGTAASARQAAGALPLRVIQPPPLPAGWCGKTWALHQGVRASTGELLVFLDADTEPGPECLERLLAQQQRLGGLVAAVAGKVVEDWFLAHCYERAGLPVSAFIGDGQVAYRMYPGGMGDLVCGFDKNFATAAGEVRWPWMLAVLLWLSGLFWAAWCLPAALLGWPLMGSTEVLPHVLVYGAYALQLLLLTRRVGRFSRINLVFPLPVLFFLAVFLLAILNLERGRVRWKGRSVRTR